MAHTSGGQMQDQWVFTPELAEVIMLMAEVEASVAEALVRYQQARYSGTEDDINAAIWELVTTSGVRGNRHDDEQRSMSPVRPVPYIIENETLVVLDRPLKIKPSKQK